MGGHPGQAVHRGEPRDAHAHRDAAGVDDGPGGFAGQTDGDSVAVESKRSGHHAQQQAQAGRRSHSAGAQAARRRAKAAGEPLTFAMTFPPGTHAMWTRYWLASGGIHPDKDVTLITIPPPQMVANMKVDKMDGFCVGEPWNSSCHCRRHRIHGHHDAADVAGSSGEGVRLHRRVCDTPPQDGEGGAQGPAPRERASGQSRQPGESLRDHFAPHLHQLSPGNHSRAVAWQVRLWRRSARAGSVLHDLLAAAVQLSAAGVRPLVAESVPTMGHGQGRARLPGGRQTGPPAGHLYGGHEGSGNGSQDYGSPKVHTVRRRHVRQRRSERSTRAVSRSTTWLASWKPATSRYR